MNCDKIEPAGKKKDKECLIAGYAAINVVPERGG